MRYSAKNMGDKFVIEVDGVVAGEAPSIEGAVALRDAIARGEDVPAPEPPKAKAPKKAKAVKS